MGYLLKVGTLKLWARPPLIIAWLLIAFPEWNTTFIGAALTLVVIAVALLKKKAKQNNGLVSQEFE